MIIIKIIKWSIHICIFNLLYTIVRARWPPYCFSNNPITVLPAFVLANAVSGTWLYLFSRFMFRCRFLNEIFLHHPMYIAAQLYTHICSLPGFPSLQPSVCTPRHLVPSTILYIFNLVIHFLSPYSWLLVMRTESCLFSSLLYP